MKNQMNDIHLTKQMHTVLIFILTRLRTKIIILINESFFAYV